MTSVANAQMNAQQTLNTAQNKVLTSVPDYALNAPMPVTMLWRKDKPIQTCFKNVLMPATHVQQNANNTTTPIVQVVQILAGSAKKNVKKLQLKTSAINKYPLD
ncbi:MAG: hypothetical protein M3Q95_03100 [Bacteroidota bacterium]|nr:hypothetical protein [Bacteroidota bacterium]